MPQATTTPQQQQVIDFITFEAYRTACNALEGMDLYKEYKDTFIIGPDTPYHTTLTSDADGTITVLNGHGYSRLHTRPGVRDNIFNNVWEHIRIRAHDQIKQAVRDAFGSSYSHTLSSNPPPKKFEEPDPAATAARKAAVAARGSLGHGYSLNAARLGFGMLYKFVGRERIAAALAAAGPYTTIDDLETYTKRQDAIQDALNRNPNATLLWFAQRRNKEIATAESAGQETDIIAEARAYLLALAPWDTDPNRLWTTFSGLNRGGVASVSGNPHTLTGITALSLQAGASPSYTALRVLNNIPEGIDNNIHPAIITAFIKESAARKGSKSGGQRQLANQLNLIAYPGSQEGATPDQTAEMYQRLEAFKAQISHNEHMTWEQVLDEMRSYLRETGKPKKRKASEASTRKQRETPKPLHRDEVKELLESELAPTVDEALRNSVHIEATAASVSLRINGSAEPAFHMSLEPTGAIKMSEETYIANGPLPDPAGHEGWMPNWTTRGAKQKAMTRTVTEELKSRWEALRPRSDCRLPAAGTINGILQRKLEANSEVDRDYRTDHQLSAELTNTIAAMLSKETYELTAAIFPAVNISNYNITARSREVVSELLRTNPGAITWAASSGLIDTPPQHPGEVIKRVRNDLVNMDVDPRHWRFITTLPADTMRFITSRNHRQTPRWQRATLLAAMATTGTISARDKIQLAFSGMGQMLIHPDFQDLPAQTKANVRRMATLLLKAAETPDSYEVRDIADYVESASIEGTPITATTWNGLRKASERWHRQMRNRVAHEEWQRILTRYDGRCRAWNSALDKHQDQELTITPLTTEYQLYQESMQMEHCVVTYGRRCADDNSRIFNISSNDRPVATIEVAQHAQGWAAVQTRGKQNHPVPADILAAAQRIATRY